MKTKTTFLLLILSVFISACVKDIDFNQINEMALTPSYTVALFKYEFNQNKLKEPTENSGLKFESSTKFSVFNDLENLKTVSIEIEINNPFKREFYLNCDFVDDLDQTMYTYKDIIVNPQEIYNDIETISIPFNNKILNATKAVITLEMLPSTTGEIIDPDKDLIFSFKSAATFQYLIK